MFCGPCRCWNSRSGRRCGCGLTRARAGTIIVFLYMLQLCFLYIPHFPCAIAPHYLLPWTNALRAQRCVRSPLLLQSQLPHTEISDLALRTYLGRLSILILTLWRDVSCKLLHQPAIQLSSTSSACLLIKMKKRSNGGNPPPRPRHIHVSTRYLSHFYNTSLKRKRHCTIATQNSQTTPYGTQARGR